MHDLPDKALSIRQPWAWAIVHAGKDIENRSWATKFRGPVCIHAANGMTKREMHAALQFMEDAGITLPATMPMRKGGIIGVAEITDCVSSSASPWFMGQYGFVLRNARPVPFIPVKGALSFFDWRSRLASQGGR